MKLVNFLYDATILDEAKPQYHYNYYDKKHYPTNGDWDNCYYDYHAPLQTVFESNGISTKSITLDQINDISDTCIYVLSYRYFADVIIFSKDKKILGNVNQKIIDLINNERCILVINDAHECYHYGEDFYSSMITKLENEGIKNFNKVLLFTGNAHNNFNCDKLTVIHWQYFETAMRLCDSNHVSENSNTSKKRFLCLNRVNRETRFYFMYQIYKMGLLNYFLASLNKIDNLDDIASYNNNVYMDQIKNEPEFAEMTKTLPWIIDIENFESNHWNTIDYSMADRSDIFVVSETLFLNGNINMFLTEKTYKPILMKMPFIVVGNAGILKHLSSLGYKTFSDIWDESYDDIENHQLRMKSILRLIKSLCELPENKFQEKMTIAKEVAIYNYNLLLSRRAESEVIELLMSKL
jgi:hypothetical protein